MRASAIECMRVQDLMRELDIRADQVGPEHEAYFTRAGLTFVDGQRMRDALGRASAKQLQALSHALLCVEEVPA